MDIDLISGLTRLQKQATAIAPPSGTALVAAQGGLRGPAFFPEGLGLDQSALRGVDRPRVMVVGHNFGCEAYRQQIDAASREDDKVTSRNLDTLLRQAGVDPELAYRTNWFVGLLPGKQQTGTFLRGRHPAYEDQCRYLLIEQVKLIQPDTILFLGAQFAARTHCFIEGLRPWKAARSLSAIDVSSIGHSHRGLTFSGTQVRVNVAALLHPSFGAVNQERRMRRMASPMTEVEIIRRAVTATA